MFLYLVSTSYLESLISLTLQGMSNEEDVILSIDIGTSNIKVAAITRGSEILQVHRCPITAISAEPGYHELCPDKLWADILELLRRASEGMESRVVGLGISTHRSTFITWKKGTQEFLHNLITWTDRRAADMCDAWNDSLTTRLGQGVLWGLGKVVRSAHMVTLALWKVRPGVVTMRLKWVMENVPRAKELYDQDMLCFGTLDTWLIYKLTCGKTWATDLSNASGTAIYDIWGGKWCPVMQRLFDLPIRAFPEVRASNSNFGKVDPELRLGFSAPIHGILADQQASVVGNKVFQEGEMKLSLGTCLSVDTVTGAYIHQEALAVYPQVGWSLANQPPCYLAESFSDETRGLYLEWLVSAGYVDHISQLEEVATSAPDTDGIFFVKSDNDLSGDVADDIVGETSDRAVIIRAVLEAHVFRGFMLLQNMFKHYGKPAQILVDGGASVSDFIIDRISELAEVDLVRSGCTEGPLLGAFFTAGVGLGWWADFKEIEDNVKLSKVSSFKNENCVLREKYEKWSKLYDESLKKSKFFRY